MTDACRGPKCEDAAPDFRGGILICWRGIVDEFRTLDAVLRPRNLEGLLALRRWAPGSANESPRGDVTRRKDSRRCRRVAGPRCQIKKARAKWPGLSASSVVIRVPQCPRSGSQQLGVMLFKPVKHAAPQSHCELRQLCGVPLGHRARRIVLDDVPLLAADLQVLHVSALLRP